VYTRWLIVLLLAAAAFSETAGRVSRVVAPDLYQLWGVSAAARLSGHTLGSPYKDLPGYWVVLSRRAEGSSDPRLRAAHTLWPTLSPIAAPLLFVPFALLPGDYATAAILFAILQALAFLASMVLLGRLFRHDRFLLLCLAFILLRAYEPLSSDMRLGNVATLQFLVLGGLLALARHLRRPDQVRHRAALGALFLGGLAVLALAKLNLGLVVALLALSFLLSSERRAAVVAVAGAAGVSMIFVLVPCAYFRTWAVWLDWYAYTFGPGQGIAGRSVEQGNYSTTRIIADLSGAPIVIPVLAVAAVLGLSLIVATSRAPEGWKARLHRAARDPVSAAAIGITATMAIAPVMWLHYYVWSLIPALWLMHIGKNDARLGGLGAASVVLSAGGLNVLLVLGGLTSLVPPVMASSWIPLGAAIWLHLARAPGEEEEIGASAQDARGGPGTRGPVRDRARRRSQERTGARAGAVSRG
jgi:glycosyl transferase family 87